jgi:uncharacterized protein YndB with AHSA1/START domain
MEFGDIERELLIDATPEIVYEVISSPEHLREWWPDDASVTASAGERGSLTFGDNVVPLTVVVADPPRTFSFRWTDEPGEDAMVGNSLLVTFTLEPQGTGTRVRMVESGFRERGWEGAVLEEAYAEHLAGWDLFIPRLGVYVDRLVAS